MFNCSRNIAGKNYQKTNYKSKQLLSSGEYIRGRYLFILLYYLNTIINKYKLNVFITNILIFLWRK